MMDKAATGVCGAPAGCLRSWAENRGGRLIAAFGTAVLLAPLLACSSSGQVRDVAPFAPEPAAVQYSLVAFATVTITSDGALAPSAISSVKVSESPVVVDVGETTQLSAEALGADGRPLSDVEIVWTVADLRAGSISKEGVFRGGGAPGTYRDAIVVTAFRNTPLGFQFASASASVTVVGAAQVQRLASVEIYPKTPTILKGQIYRMRAVGFDVDGRVIPNVSFKWELAAAALGSLNDIGYLTVSGDAGLYGNAVKVTGQWGLHQASGTADVNVMSAPRADDFLNVQILPHRFYLDPGGQLKLRAVALNGLGELVRGTQLRWQVVDAASGVVDANGLFTAGRTPGIYTEAVLVEAVIPGERGYVRAQDMASVVVRQQSKTRVLHAVWAVPESVTVGRGGRVFMTPRAVDAAGAPADNVAFKWEVLDPAVGVVNEHGGFVATGRPAAYPGALRVTAAQQLGDELIERNVSVDVVITGTLSDVSVTPDRVVTAPGRTLHFNATGRDEYGTTLPGLVVRWSVTDPAAGRIDAFGIFTAGREPGVYDSAVRAELVQTLPAD